jgi:hypothetical protein
MIDGINPCFGRDPPALECGLLGGFLERLDQFITLSHLSTEMGDLAYSFYSMMQLYVLRYAFEAIGKMRRICLKITNDAVPLLIGMLLSLFYRSQFVPGFDAMTDGAPEIKISRD